MSKVFFYFCSPNNIEKRLIFIFSARDKSVISTFCPNNQKKHLFDIFFIIFLPTAQHAHRYYYFGSNSSDGSSSVTEHRYYIIKIIISIAYLFRNNLLFVLIKTVSGYSRKTLAFGIVQRTTKIN